MYDTGNGADLVGNDGIYSKYFTQFNGAERYSLTCRVTFDGGKVALVAKELAGKNLEEVIAAGTEKLGSVPSGGIFENL